MMQILSIHLKNIKSHRDTTLNFAAGINVLSGANGVGKSTVFEAIGYALFGVDARDFVSNIERFLTIGAKRGEVTVTFAAGTGETFRVTRTVGAPTTWRLARENGGGFEVEDHAGGGETEERIRELLGLAKGRSLAEQFKLVIGPFQSDFLGPFVLKQPTRRKEAFDEILGIDSWRKTFEGTKELGSALKGKISNVETEIAGKEDRIACLPQRKEELAALALEEETKGTELKKVATDLAAAVDLLQGIEEKKSGIERLRNELAQVEQNLATGNEYVVAQQFQVEEAEAAAWTAEAARPGRERFEAAETRLRDLREREKAKQSLEKEIASLEAQAASAALAAGHEEREAAEQAKRLADGRTAVAAEESELGEKSSRSAEEQKGLQLAFERLREIDALFQQLPLVKVETIIPYLRVTLEHLVTLDARVHEKKNLLLAEDRWQESAAALAPLRKEREELLAAKSGLLGKRLGLTEGEAKLQAGICPFFAEQCGNLTGMGSLEVFPDRRRHLDRDIATLDAAIAALDINIAAAEAAAKEMERFRLLRNEIANLEKERRERELERERNLRQLNPAGVLAAFADWVEKYDLEECRQAGAKLLAGDFSGTPAVQLSALEEWEKGCHEVAAAVRIIIGTMLSAAEAPLAGIKGERAKLDVRHQELGRRQRELAETEKRVGERTKAATAHSQIAAQADRERRKRTDLLASYRDVEPGIRDSEEERRFSQPDHQRFLQAEPIAKDLPKRQETLAKYRKRLSDLQTERSSKIATLGELEKDYSPESHAEQRRKKEALQDSAATLKESLKNLAQNRLRLTLEIADLEQVRQAIDKKREEVRDLCKKEEMVKFLRNRVFKNVSAQLSERFREEISLRADRIYRTISEADEELIWGEDYRIILRDLVDQEVRERTDDQLSGGQTMSAVVALRLALLQTIGARIAFFDEPTSNLDASRRENLAHAFRAIDHGKEEVTEHWYDQLFLVSHDVAFTEITDQIIQLGELPENLGSV
jgi:DNA repair protein SbcC/Rad50